MTNSLCDADVANCIGFPSSSGCGPQYPVSCYAGNPVVEKITACKMYQGAIATVYNTPMSTATENIGTLLEVSVTNPFCVEAAIHVSHEFGAKFTVSQTDNWALRGDISCAGMTLFSGGTGGMFTVAGNDGSALTTDSRVFGVTEQRTFEAMYVLAAGASGVIRQQTVVYGIYIGGLTRVLNNMDTAMKIMIFPRQT